MGTVKAAMCFISVDKKSSIEAKFVFFVGEIITQTNCYHVKSTQR